MKKFYKEVAVAESDGGFSIELDGRAVKTPGKNALSLPNEMFAEAVADEWRAQDEEIAPDTMPLTQLMNTAIDRVAPRRNDVIEELLAFAHTDVVCYRTGEPDEFITLQKDTWDPFLAWLKASHGVSLDTTDGIMALKQADLAVETLQGLVSALSDAELTVFHSYVCGFGSIVLALAAIQGFKPLEDCWQASILEQTFQESLWGTDYEVEEKRERLWAELAASHEFWRLLKT